MTKCQWDSRSAVAWSAKPSPASRCLFRPIKLMRCKQDRWKSGQTQLPTVRNLHKIIKQSVLLSHLPHEVLADTLSLPQSCPSVSLSRVAQPNADHVISLLPDRFPSPTSTLTALCHTGNEAEPGLQRRQRTLVSFISIPLPSHTYLSQIFPFEDSKRHSGLNPEHK